MSNIQTRSEPDVDSAAGSTAHTSDQVAASPVNARRRRLAKFAVGGPVLVTLASRPVMAGNCLSNMLSGNLSDPNRGTCSRGWSPGGWGQPGGNISSYTTLGAWSAIGLTYGVLKSNGSPNQSADYTGGSELGDVHAALNKGGLPNSTTLRDVLINPSLDQLTRHLVCAYLNARLGALPSSSFHYVMTPQQVVDLANGALWPSSYTTLQLFLGSTWN